MPTRKIADLGWPDTIGAPVVVPLRNITRLPRYRAPQRPCRHPEHNPPNMMVLENGVYEHECPSCGTKQIFTVDKPTLNAGPCRNRFVPEE